MEDVVFLEVPFLEKDQAKALGARWHGEPVRKWYISKNENLDLFKKWWPANLADEIQVTSTEEITVPSKQHFTIREIKSRIQGSVQQLFPGEIWLIGEIIKLTPKNGHLYIELQDDDAVQANNKKYTLRAMVWKEKASYVASKFKNETGLELSLNQKVRLKVNIKFDGQYDLSATVNDIDPEITLGKIALDQRRIKEQLTKEGIFHQNAKLPSPKDFCRVAVIHPSNASGFHDVRSSADRLAGLCEFIYIESRFEGVSVERDMDTAFQQALTYHEESPLDALIIIRGGGARHGLLSLITEPIIRHIATFPIPVITGIGHTDDKLLIDEVANQSCGTPSKVIQLIEATIYQNAHNAMNHFTQIVNVSKHCINNWYNELDKQYASLGHRVRNLCHLYGERIQSQLAVIKSKAFASWSTLQKDTKKYMRDIHRESLGALKVMQNNLHHYRGSITLGSRDKIKGGFSDISSNLRRIVSLANLAFTQKKNAIDGTMSLIKQSAQINQRRIADKLNTSFKMVQSLSPEKTLKRGYSLAFSDEGNVIKTVQAAKSEGNFTLRFSEGKCRVTFKEEIKS